MPSIEHDDLIMQAGIKGVGDRHAQHLETVGITRVSELAASSVEGVRGAYKEAGLRVPGEATVAPWIEEAAKWIEEAANRARVSRATTDESLEESRPSRERATIAAHGWENYATFMVEFQSRDVVHRAVEHQVVVREPESDLGKTFALEQGAGAFEWMRRHLQAIKVEGSDLPEAADAAKAESPVQPAEVEAPTDSTAPRTPVSEAVGEVRAGPGPAPPERVPARKR